MLIDKEITLDVTQGHPVENVRFHQGDENSIRLKITLTDKNEIVSAVGCSVLYNATIRGYLVESEATGYTDGSAIYIPVTPNMTALDGQLNIEIKIVETDENNKQEVLYTRNLIAFVERSIIEGDLMIDFSGLTIVDIIKSKLDDAPGVITSSHLKESSVTASKIASSAVSSAKIASGAVTSAKLGSSSVTSSKISNDAVTNEKLADDAVGEDELQDGAVTPNKLASNAVTSDKISSQAVGTTKIANSAITNQKMAANAVAYRNLDSILQTMIDSKIQLIRYGTVASWDALPIDLDDNALYFVDTFAGSMATSINYGNCIGFANTSTNTLMMLQLSTGIWWRINVVNQTFSQATTIPAKKVSIVDIDNNYESMTLEDALIEIATKKADYEKGTITTDNVAWYTNDPNCLIRGYYQLAGDYCTITANAALVDGWGVVFYSLPVACVNGVASTIAVGTKQYIVKTTMLSNISTIEIKRMDGSLITKADDPTIAFTLTYKYR